MQPSELQMITQNFLAELRSSVIAPTGSLPFIVHQLPEGATVPENEQFQVMVIGGSICKSARVVRSRGGISILQKTEVPQPAFASQDSFLSFIADQLFENVHALALNFAYHLQPLFENGILDGVLIEGGKEHAFEGLIGRMVGQGVSEYVKEKKGKDVRVSVANDTVCLLLSGLTQYGWDHLAGGIVGTGMNFAIFLEKNKIVNLESANFNVFPQSEEGKVIDADSQLPGKHMFEKEISGAYLYQHFNMVAKKQGMVAGEITSTEALDALARGEGSGSTIARELLMRSAALVACQVAGIMLFSGKDTTFVMEGSLFWNSWQYKEHVEETVRQLTQYKATFVRVEESSILGAAKLLA